MMTAGVLPAPPSVKLPTHSTGRPGCTPVFAMRRAAIAPSMSPRGARSWASGLAPRHQKAGSRMASSLMKLQLHEIGIERRQCAIKRATEGLDHCMSGIRDPCAGIGVAEPRGEVRDKAVRAGNRLRAVRIVKRGVDFPKVPDVRAVQNCGAELRG